METEGPEVLREPANRRFLRACAKPRFASKEAQLWLGAHLKMGGEDAAAAATLLVEANMPLAVSIAVKKRGRGISVEDLIQEAFCQLYIVASSFDPDKMGSNASFVAYATTWLRKRMQEYIDNHSRIVRVSRKTLEQGRQLALMKRTVGPLPDREMAALLKVTIRRLREIERSMHMEMSLDAPLLSDANQGDDDNDTKLGDILEAPHRADESIEDRDHARTIEALEAALDILDPREREVIIRRFGLFGHEIELRAKIGEHFEVSDERIRQIEKGALKKLKKPLERFRD